MMNDESVVLQTSLKLCRHFPVAFETLSPENL